MTDLLGWLQKVVANYAVCYASTGTIACATFSARALAFELGQARVPAALDSGSPSERGPGQELARVEQALALAALRAFPASRQVPVSASARAQNLWWRLLPSVRASRKASAKSS